MVTSDDIGSHAGEGGVYEFNALGVLQLYGQFVEGGPNCTLAVVSRSPLGQKARSALEASAERLEYGRDACVWVTLSDGECELGAADLRTLLEGLDPSGIVAADADAAAMLAKAYSTSLKMDAANRAFCRTVVALHDFESMIEDDGDKRLAWAALKKLAF